MQNKIKAMEHNINDIFSHEYVFEIPVYQRPYAWTTEQVSELLDDLIDAMKKNDQSPYFLGSIVLIKDENSSHSTIVDGQQRLTTLTMLFCVLRELAPEDVQIKLNAFVKEDGNDFRGTQDSYRLSLREMDRQFFQNNVQSRGAICEFIQRGNAFESSSQKQIFTNIKYLYDQLSSKCMDRDAFAKFIISQCYLVVVTVTDSESAYRVFSVMNDRGLDLSPTDILKSEVIGRIDSSDDQSYYGKKWENIEEQVGRSGFRDLFAHIRMITLKSKLRRTLQADFRDNVLRNIGAAEFIDDMLAPYSDVYGTLLNASYESAQGADKLNGILYHLRWIDNFDWIPPAMEFFHCHFHDQDVLIAFTKDLERLAYGLFIRRANVNERIVRYANVLSSIQSGGDLFDFNSPLQLKSTEVDQIVKVLNGDIYLETPVVSRVLLMRLNSLITDGGDRQRRSTTTIEHVLPQKPRADSEWDSEFNLLEREHWTHKLANLVLLSRRKNSSASNWDFGQKKEKYFQPGNVTPFALTTEVLNESEWTPAVLQSRQKRLVGYLVDEWRLDLVHTETSNC